MRLIEAAHADDARAVAQIHVDAWRSAYVGIFPDDFLAALSVDERETMWREAIASQRPELLVARIDGRVIGWISFGASRDDHAAADVGEVWALYLDPRHVSTGAGHALWQRACERLIERGFKTAMLWMLAGNVRAKRFYERMGCVVETDSARSFTINELEIEELRCSISL